ncbi:MAG TPA: TonB-dependent receptor [Candidatus Binatia bacterium]|nr:TonB-dependent receptor [Candidatus Binatia bacterium]
MRSHYGFALRGATLLLTVSSFGLGVAQAQASAQPEAPAEDPLPQADSDASQPAAADIVVTGSRLGSGGFKAPTPVSVVGSDEIKLRGALAVEDALIQQPQFVGNQFNASGNGQNQGVAALNLRGLGERRSLTLVNGRRYTVTGTNGLTDLNTIPNALIKRVEVVTGGSSAVYGSDALAGVVNFILREDFKGLEATASYRTNDHTWTPEKNLSLTVGSDFADDRGNAVVSLDYLDRGGILRDEYSFTRTQLNDGCVTAASFSNSAAGIPLSVPAGQTCTSAGGRAGFVAANSATIPGGRFVIPVFNSPQSNPALNAALLAAGLQNMTTFGFTFDPGSNAARPALDPSDRYNNSPLNYMQTPLERWMINSFAHYDIDDHVTAFVEGHVSKYVSNVQIAPLALSNNILVDVNNPYLSLATQNVLRALDASESGTTTVTAGLSSFTNAPNDGRAVIASNRRFAEGGASNGRTERNVFRAAAGLRGDINDSWKYDAYYSYASTLLTENQSAAISLSRLQRSILSQGGAAPALNIFGPNITAAAYAGITVPATNETRSTQNVVAGNLAGSLFELPAGSVDVSTGFEWRKNSIDRKPDAAGLIGEVASAIGTPSAISGSTTVKEGYGEIRVPIISDKPFFHRLAVNGALRYSDYNTPGVGGVWTYSYGGQWSPTSDFTVRGQVQRAIRAPGVDELFAPQLNGTPVVNDPCSNRVSPSQQTQAVRDLCIATGVPAANVFTAVIQPNAQVGVLTGGNPNLGAETADTVTAGISYTPQSIPGLAVSVDWYTIDLEGAIAGLGGTIQNTFNLCYFIEASASSRFCQAIRRSPTGELTSSLQSDPFYVEQFLDNTGGIKVSGVDFNAQYAFDVGFSPLGGDNGRVTLNTAWSYTDEYTFIPVQALDVKNECVGSFGAVCGPPAPRFKGVSRASLRTGPLTLSLQHRYVGPVTRDLFVVPSRQGLTPPNKSDITAVKVDAYHYLDLSFLAELPGDLSFSGGINNVFDKDPPLLGSGAQTWGVNTAPGVYDIYGRTMFVSVTKRF